MRTRYTYRGRLCYIIDMLTQERALVRFYDTRRTEAVDLCELSEVK